VSASQDHFAKGSDSLKWFREKACYPRLSNFERAAPHVRGDLFREILQDHFAKGSDSLKLQNGLEKRPASRAFPTSSEPPRHVHGDLLLSRDPIFANTDHTIFYNGTQLKQWALHVVAWEIAAML
jgi:hypothetical protein